MTTNTNDTPAQIGFGLQREIEQYLFAEGDLLDGREFPAWLNLFHEECVYWIPGEADTPDPSTTVSIVYDTKATLAERAWRFEGGLAYAQEPSSTTSHLIGNVVVTDVDERAHADGVVYTVTSRFVVNEYRNDTNFVHAGRYTHRLVRTDESFLILEKRVDLISRKGHLGNLALPI